MTTKQRYTPGPWKLNKGDWSSIEAETDMRNSDGIPLTASIASIWREENGLPVSENKANARLITAAPDFLVACKKLIAYRDSYGPLNFQLEKADYFIHLMRIAVEKVEGK